jgi:hypothetical protein
MSGSGNTTRSRSIRHPQASYDGAQLIGNIGNTNGSNSGGNRRLSTRSGGTGTTTTTTTTRSSAANYNNHSNGNTRESVAEFQDLLYQANYAASHYEDQPRSPVAAMSMSTAQAAGVTQTQPLRLGQDSIGALRSKTPVDARRVRNSLHKANPYTSTYSTTNSLSQSTGSAAQRTMATSSSPPTRPSRNNTSNLLDFTQSNPNQETRQRRLSLPGSPPANHNYFEPNGNAAFPGDFVNTMGTSTPPPLRSRSGTQSVKNKKGMLSFMSGAFYFLLYYPYFMLIVFLIGVVGAVSLWHTKEARDFYSIRPCAPHARWIQFVHWRIHRHAQGMAATPPRIRYHPPRTGKEPSGAHGGRQVLSRGWYGRQ